VVVLASGWLLACAHAPDAGKRASCPDSETAGQCSSGGWSCKVDEKRGCELCSCEHMVF